MKKRVYNAAESGEFIKKYIPIPKQEVVKDIGEITINPPFVLKILSKDALHKTEFNGVQIVKYKEALKPAFNSMIKEAKIHGIHLDGIMVQEFFNGIESIIGIKKDPVFGHVILFGAGGIFTEAIKDTSTRKCPISLNDAGEMIDELKSRKIFYGERGKKISINKLKEALVSISKLPTKHPEIEEIDINPFTLSKDKCLAVDVRIVSS